MADKYLNETGILTIRDWANGKFATGAALDTLSGRVDEIIDEGGEPNIIEMVKVNGTALTPVDKAVNIDLSDYATEDYVDQNGGKIDKIKVNGQEQTITNKEVDLTIEQFVFDSDSDGHLIWGTIGTDTKMEIGVQEGGRARIDIYTGADDHHIAELASIEELPAAVSDLYNDLDFQTASDVATAINAAVASAYVYRGSVATADALPSSGQTVGDVYDVQASGMNYAWNGSEWDALGVYVDTSVFWTSQSGQPNTLEAMTVAEINAILNQSA